MSDRISVEQLARDMLDRMGVDDAQEWTAGRLVELANLISKADALEAMQKALVKSCEEGREHLIQCPVATDRDCLRQRVEGLEAKYKELEEIYEECYQELIDTDLGSQKFEARVEQLEAAFRKIKEALGDDFIVHELRCALDNSDPDGYSHPEDKRYYEEMRPHFEAVLKHFGG